MTLDELPGYLAGIRERVAESMIPVCDAIGDEYREHLVNETLTESGAHGPATAAGFPPSAPEGRPPMMMTGNLAATVIKSPASGGGGSAECFVSPTTIYAATIHWGAVHTGKPLMVLWQKYVGYHVAKDKHWLRRTVKIGSRPYMIIAVEESMREGILTKAAMESFEGTVWG